MSLSSSDPADGWRRLTGSQLVAGMAFVFLALAVFAAVYFRITRVDNVSIGMVAQNQPATSAVTATTAPLEVTETTPPETAAPVQEETTTTFAISTLVPTAPAATGVPMKGLLQDGRVRLTGAVPDIAIGKAFTTLIEGFVGEGNVDEFFTLDDNADVPNSFTLQIVDNVVFDAGGETVSADSFPILGQIVSFMKLDPNVTLVVEGHTDSTGSEVENLALSQRRADAVRSYLAEQGINEFRLEAQGRGDSNPVAENSTPAGRDQNRRIEFRLVGFKVAEVE